MPETLSEFKIVCTLFIKSYFSIHHKLRNNVLMFTFDKFNRIDLVRKTLEILLVFDTNSETHYNLS